MRPALARDLVTDEDDVATLDAIGTHLGISGERVRQVEAVALKKVRIALALVPHLGAHRAHVVWRELRGRPLGDFERALCEAREATCST